MQFRAEQYYQVSLERMQQARRIYQQGSAYALAIYCGGLAVESLLRAFRWTEDSRFEGRHDLSELLAASGLLKIDYDFMRRKGASDGAIENQGRELRAAMNGVVMLWHNNLRFASEASLKAFLRKTQRLHGIKGDPIKGNAIEFLDAAQTVVNRGVILWQLKKKS